MGKVIGVISLKGGVGKTSSVCALGDAIASLGKKVLLIDGNLSAPNLALHLDIIDNGKTLHDLLNDKANAGDVIFTGDNFDVIPADIFNRSKVNALALKKKIRSLKDKYDYVIIDSSPSLDDETLAVMLASDAILVATTADLPTLSATIKATNLARQRGTPIVGMILNKVYNKKFELSIDEIEKMAELPVMAVIPHDKGFASALSKFEPFTTHKPLSEGADEYKKLAATLLGESYSPIRLRRFMRWVSPKRQDINRMIFYDNVFK